MLTEKMNLSDSAIAELRQASVKARRKMYESAKYSSGHYKTMQEQYACMELAKLFAANDWELTGDQIRTLHTATYGSNGQNPGKLVWIAKNKADNMPGLTIEAQLLDSEYNSWIIMSTGSKESTRYVAVQVPDYAKFYGDAWADNITKPASGLGRKQKKLKDDATATVEPVASTQSEVVEAIAGQYPDPVQNVESVDVEVTEVVLEQQETEIVEESVPEQKLSKNERRKLARQKAAAKAKESVVEEAA